MDEYSVLIVDNKCELEKMVIFVSICDFHERYGMLYMYIITRAASWGTDHRKWLFSAVRGCIHLCW